MGQYLDFLLNGSPDHKVERRGDNTYQITAAVDGAQGYAKFDTIVRTADTRAAVEGFGVLKHPDSMHAGREFDFAVITVRENPRPFQPDPSQWSNTSNWDDAAVVPNRMFPQRNAALLDSSMGSQVFAPPPEQAVSIETVQPANSVATVDTPPGAGAGTAPREIKTTPVEAHSGAALEASGSLAANADVLRADRRAITTITQNLAANTSENQVIAQGLLQVTQAKIAELRDARLNDRETADLIQFLEWLARGLTELVENLDRAIADPSEPIFLGTAGEIARNLKLGLLDAVEKHRVKIWEVGALVGVGLFLSSLSGEKLSDILKILLK